MEIEKTLNEFIELLFKTIFQVALKGFKGISKLKSIGKIVTFIFSFIVLWIVIRYKLSLFAYADKLEMPIWFKMIIFVLLCGLPFWYLVLLQLLEERTQKKYIGLFQEMGFHGKDGKFPCFLKAYEDDGKTIYNFKSNIPLSEWQKAEERIETVFDCTIVNFENTSSKRIMKMETVQSDRRIPKLILWEDKYLSQEEGTIAIGQGAIKRVEFNLNDNPHVLVAGETGSGKSVILHTIWWQVVLKYCKTFMFDFKGGVEFSKQYEQYGEVVTERKRALEILTMLCEENDRRMKLFRDLGVKKLTEYNEKYNKNLIRIVIFCDEIAEMLDETGVSKEEKPVYEAIRGRLSTLARLSRASGINLILGTQRPDAKIITGQIKTNITLRVSGRFADKPTSEIVLGNSDAVRIPNIKGRFLIKNGIEMTEFQSYLFKDTMLRDDVPIPEGALLIEKEGNQLHNSYYDNSDPVSEPTGKTVDLKKDTRKEEKTLDLDFDY